MTYYRFPETRKTKLLLALSVFVMLYLARDSMFCQSVIGFYPSQFMTLGLVGLMGIAFLYHNRSGLKPILTDGRMIAVAVVSALILIPMLVKRDWQMMYLSILLCLYIAIFLSYFMTMQEAAKYYVVILSCLAVFSLLMAYIFRWLWDFEILQGIIFQNGSGYDFYNFVFSVVPLRFVWTRNFGIFREPGVYQYFLILGIFLNHYVVAWKKGWQMWTVTAILALTTVSTLSTSGVAVLGLLAVFIFFDQKMYRSKVLLILALVLILAVTAVLYVSYVTRNFLYWELYTMIVQKLTAAGEDSVSDRMLAVMADLRIFLANPIFGERLSVVLHSAEHNTTSSLILLAAFGAVSGGFHILAWAALLWRKSRSVLGNLILMGLMFLTFNTQNLTWDLFFWLFPVMALVEKGVPLLKRKVAQ